MRAPLALLALAALAGGCHDFAALSSQYGAADLGCDVCGDLAALPVADLAAPADLALVPGHLTGSAGVPPLLVDLTLDGTLDWTHYGYPVGGDEEQKAHVTSQISYYDTLSGFTATGYVNDPVRYRWEDGTTTPLLAPGTNTGMFRTGDGDGFRITVAASSRPRTLEVYVGGYRTSGTLTATLSDGSAPAYTNTTPTRTDDLNYDVLYTLDFNASRDGEKLTVVWKLASATMPDGNVTLQAAALH